MAAPRWWQHVVAAANVIAGRPYVYGGGHGSFESAGYDCSGSVSYALHGGGLLSSPLTSSAFMSYGAPGPGQHITIYANPGHVYMIIDGRRFDTSARSETGSRWTGTGRSGAATSSATRRASRPRPAPSPALAHPSRERRHHQVVRVLDHVAHHSGRERPVDRTVFQWRLLRW